MCFVPRSVKCSICWRQETPATLTVVVGGRGRRPPGRAAPRRSCARPRSARLRSRRSRPCRSSRRRSPSPCSPRLASIAIDGPMPISAFWWQWPWKRTSGPAPSFQTMPRSPACVQLGQELVDHEGLAGDRRDVRVVGKEVAVLVAQGQDAARLGADDRDALLGVGGQHARRCAAPACARLRRDLWRASGGRSRRGAPRR